MPVLTKDLARRVEQSEVDALESRLTAILQRNGNPMDVEIQRFGNATAFSIKGIPGPSYNTVKGISGEDVDYVDDILHFYREKNIPVRFEITPADASQELFATLAEKGFYHSDFHTSLYGQLNGNVPEESPFISIRTLEKDEFETFADIYVRGFGMPDFLKEGVAANNVVLHNKNSWAFYLAFIENKPAGIGVQFVKDGVGTLAASATVPELRKNGVQSELIRKRMSKASELGCELIVGQTKFGSVSHHNMERAGMKVAYTKAIWIKK